MAGGGLFLLDPHVPRALTANEMDTATEKSDRIRENTVALTVANSVRLNATAPLATENRIAFPLDGRLPIG